MKRDPTTEKYRVRTGQYASKTEDGDNGAFKFKFQKSVFVVICSDQQGWDHVSVSLHDRCPTWPEMCLFKELFFGPDEWVVQYHPAKTENVNNMINCLHMWRPQDVEVPKPPSFMV